MRHQTTGSTLLVVLLLSMIILGGIIATVSTSAVSARAGTNNEYQSYAALLAAEAGINTFANRVMATSYAGAVQDIDCWVQGSRATDGSNSASGSCPTSATRRIADYTLGTNSINVRTEVISYNAAQQQATIRSTATERTQSRKVVVQDFTVVKPSAANIAAPAALTSCPRIDLGGSGEIIGAPWSGTARNGTPTISTTDNGVLTNITTVASGGAFTIGASASPRTATVVVADDSTLGIGNYIRIGGNIYKINSRGTANRSFVIQALSNNTVSGSVGNTVDLVQFAVRSSVTVSSTGFQTIPVSDASGFYVGDVVYMRVGNTNYKAIVNSISNTTSSSGSITVRYPATATNEGYNSPTNAVPLTSGLVLPEGLGISRFVPAASSAGGITTGGASNIGPMSSTGFNNNPSIGCGDTLFSQTFAGKTKQNLYDLATVTSTLPSPVVDGVTWVGPSNTTSFNNMTYSYTSSGLCGGGILIVNGNLRINGTCSSGFTGLIYVMGDLSTQGNADVRGAVVVEGATRINTNVNGTFNVTYDPKILLQRARALSLVSITAVSGTWRQQ